MLIDTKVTEFPITKAWEKGQKAIKANKMDLARDYFDSGIAMTAAYSDLVEDYSDDLMIENKRRGLWLMRFWVALEKNNLLLGS